MGGDPADRRRAEQQLGPYLRSGERLLWAGVPDPDVTFTPRDAFLVPFSLLWAGFSIFWELSAWSAGPVFFRIWGVPFVAIGLYIVFGRFIYKRRAKRRTAYGITADRAIVVLGSSRMLDSPIKGVPLDVRRRNGHASVTFGSNPIPMMSIYENSGMDFFIRSAGCVGMYDVADDAAMLAAIDTARQ